MLKHDTKQPLIPADAVLRTPPTLKVEKKQKPKVREKLLKQQQKMAVVATEAERLPMMLVRQEEKAMKLFG